MYVAPPTTAPPTTAAPKPPPAPPTTKPKAPTSGRTETGGATYYEWHDGQCAHKTLPKGTRVRVTYLATGKSITCVVTDRGPFGAGMVIDLDPTDFAKLAPLRQGVMQVRLSW